MATQGISEQFYTCSLLLSEAIEFWLHLQVIRQNPQTNVQQARPAGFTLKSDVLDKPESTVFLLYTAIKKLASNTLKQLGIEGSEAKLVRTCIRNNNLDN